MRRPEEEGGDRGRGSEQVLGWPGTLPSQAGSFQSRPGRRTAPAPRPPPPVGTVLAFPGLFSSLRSPAREAPRRGDIYNPHQRPSPPPPAQAAPLAAWLWPGGPAAARPCGDPKAHFSEGDTELGPRRGGDLSPRPPAPGRDPANSPANTALVTDADTEAGLEKGPGHGVPCRGFEVQGLEASPWVKCPPAVSPGTGAKGCSKV